MFLKRVVRNISEVDWAVAPAAGAKYSCIYNYQNGSIPLVIQNFMSNINLATDSTEPLVTEYMIAQMMIKVFYLCSADSELRRHC